MIVDPNDLAPRDRYHWMVSSIVPRPIAFVSTISAAGLTNLAPFSYFNGVCANPPIVSICIGVKKGGVLKDTPHPNGARLFMLWESFDPDWRDLQFSDPNIEIPTLHLSLPRSEENPNIREILAGGEKGWVAFMDQTLPECSGLVSL